jgi:hypothetical protein
LLVAAALWLGCAGSQAGRDRRGQVDGTAFELSTGGTAHTDEYGSWTVRVRGDALWISQFKDGKAREFGTFQLSGNESDKLWTLIEDARIHKRREGGSLAPEAPSYSFTVLRPKKLAHTATLTMNATGREVELDDLVRYVQKLVRKYTRKKAVLLPPEE